MSRARNSAALNLREGPLAVWCAHLALGGTVDERKARAPHRHDLVYLPSGSKIGVGYQAHALANALVDRGHSVTMFSGCKETDRARYVTETVHLNGANRTFKFAWRLRDVDWSAYDVIHAHGDNYWLWDRSLPPTIRTMHGSCFSEARFVCGARNRVRMLLLGSVKF